jgi:hypothetical protein
MIRGTRPEIFFLETVMTKAFTLVFFLSPLAAFAGEKTTLHCEKNGRNGQPAFARADLTFDVAVDGRNGLRTITDLRGEVRAAYDARELETDDAYIGLFDTKRVAEDPRYRPSKYKNSSKFPGIDAKETTGAESGMWGYLVVPRDVRGEFESHYIFQAGDHMGGTVHMKCRVSEPGV